MLRLRNSEIDVKTLGIVQNNRLSFLNLCSLLSEADVSAEPNVQCESSKTAEFDENKQGTPSSELFLDMRIEELEAFAKERDAVQSLVEMCSIDKSGKSIKSWSSKKLLTLLLNRIPNSRHGH